MNKLRNTAVTITADITGTKIEGNYINTDPSGLISEWVDDFSITAIVGYGGNTTIGGSDPAQRNVISARGTIFSGVGGVGGNTWHGNNLFVGADSVTALSPDPAIMPGRNALGLLDNDTFGGGGLGEGNTIENYLGQAAVSVTGANVTVAGNRIIGNSQGILVSSTASNTTIGGDASAGEGNIISGNIANGNAGGNGILLFGTGATTITGNYIGVLDDGETALANTTGIFAYDTTEVTIGGSTAAERNVVSGNDTYGIYAQQIGSLQISNNYVGVATDGTTAVANDGDGVTVESSDNSTIDDNTIVNNGDDGLELFRSDVVSVIGNTITDNTDDGIYTDEVTDSVIGGSGNVNTISGNGGVGVSVTHPVSSFSILENSIFDNGELGIDLQADGVTSNDATDADTGPNDLLNYPETEAEVSGADTDIVYRVDVPAGDYLINFYSNTSADPSGYGEGETFIGSDTFTSAGSGVEEFSHTVSGNTHTNIFANVTEVDGATTSGYGATSEFGTEIVRQRDVEVTKTVVDQDTITTDGYIDYTVTFTNNGPDTLDVTQFDADAGDPLNTALFNDIYPDGLTFSSVTGDADCSESNAANTFGTLFSDHSSYTVLSCAYSGVTPRELAEDESMTFTLRFTVDDNSVKIYDNHVLSVPLAEDLSLTSYQTAVSSGNDIIDELGGSNNNLSSATTTQPETAISVTKTLTDPENYVQGGTVNWTMTISNLGGAPINLADSDGSGVNPFITSLLIDFLPPDMTFAGTSTPNISCPIIAPATAAPFFPNYPDYQLVLCNHSDAVDNILLDGDSFDINFSATIDGDSDLNYLNFAFAPGYPSQGLNDEVIGEAFDTTRDAIDHLIENPISQFAYSGAPTDIELGVELLTPDDVLAGETIQYEVTLTNNGPGDINLASYSDASTSLLGGLYDAQALTLDVDSPTTDVECSDFGPGSYAFLGPAGADHTEHQYYACVYTGESTILASGESFSIILNFAVNSGFASPFSNYFFHTSTAADSDISQLLTVFFTASEDVLDTITGSNNYFILATNASPARQNQAGNSGQSTNSGEDSASLSGTGESVRLIVVIAVVLLGAGFRIYRIGKVLISKH